MITAKLASYLKDYGYELYYPDYEHIEEPIIEILKSGNERLYFALPLLLADELEIEYILKKLTIKEKRIFSKIMRICKEIEKKEKIQIINPNNRIIGYDIPRKEIKKSYESYLEHFLDSKKKKDENDERKIGRSIEIRSKYTTNQAIKILYSKGKIRILDKIFNLKPLTKTELEYYYRSIRPISRAILNKNLLEYIGFIESSKKYKE